MFKTWVGKPGQGRKSRDFPAVEKWGCGKLPRKSKEGRYGRNDGFTDETAAAPGPASPAADSGQRGL